MMTMKIQIRKGTEQPTAKLDEEKVRYIRRRVKAEGKAIYGELAAELGVSASVIGNVARYQSWRWVTDRPGEEVELAYIELKGKAPRGRPRRKRR